MSDETGLIGATINRTGSFVFRATRVGRDTTLAQIVRMVEDAQGSRAPMQRLADTVAAYFVPAVIAIAVLTFTVWMVAGPDIGRLTFAVSSAIAVLIIACPCALGLATPTAIMVGTGKAAELGILIGGGEALEQARHIDTIVLDKTGTLTRGRPTVTAIVPVGTDGATAEHALLRLAAAAEVGSEHPLGEAIVAHARERGITPPAAERFQAVAGHGITARGDGGDVVVGNAALLARHSVELDGLTDVADDMARRGATPMFVASAGRPVGVIAVADSLKAESADAVEQLRALGLDVWMLTGDNAATARAVAGDAGIEHVLDFERRDILALPAKRIAQAIDEVVEALAITAQYVPGTEVGIPRLEHVVRDTRRGGRARRSLRIAARQRLAPTLLGMAAFGVAGAALAGAGPVAAVVGGQPVAEIVAAPAQPNHLVPFAPLGECVVGGVNDDQPSARRKVLFQVVLNAFRPRLAVVVA